MVCSEDHFTKYCPHLTKIQQYVKGHPLQPIFLTNTFPPQQQQMVAQTPTPPNGGNVGAS